MNRSLKISLLIFVILAVLIGLIYYAISQIDFIGYKDPEVMKANRERNSKILLSAEYRNGTDYVKITLLDSVNIQINAGNSAVGSILTKKYTISGDPSIRRLKRSVSTD